MSRYDIGPEIYSDEWYDLRLLDEDRQPQFVCGASDAGVICGTSKYKTPLQLYMEVRCLTDQRDDTEMMYWGKKMEPIILDRFCEENGLEITRPTNMFLSKQFPFIGASLDACGTDHDGELITIDAKNSSFRMYDPENCRERDMFGDGDDDVPRDYIWQAHQQMFVYGAGRHYLPVLFDGNRYRQYCIERDDRLVEVLIRKITEFHRCVVEAEPPEPDFEHETTPNLIKTMFYREPGKEITLGDEAAEWFTDYMEAKDAIKKGEAAKSRSLARLLYGMGDAETAIVPGTGKRIKRTLISDTYWSQSDIDEAMAKIGKVKRRGYIRVTDGKA